jgi:hypothetical protein
MQLTCTSTIDAAVCTYGGMWHQRGLLLERRGRHCNKYWIGLIGQRYSYRSCQSPLVDCYNSLLRDNETLGVAVILDVQAAPTPLIATASINCDPWSFALPL